MFSNIKLKITFNVTKVFQSLIGLCNLGEVGREVSKLGRENYILNILNYFPMQLNPIFIVLNRYIYHLRNFFIK